MVTLQGRFSGSTRYANKMQLPTLWCGHIPSALQFQEPHIATILMNMFTIYPHQIWKLILANCIKIILYYSLFTLLWVQKEVVFAS